VAAVVVMQQACLLGEGVVGVDLRLCCSQKEEVVGEVGVDL